MTEVIIHGWITKYAVGFCSKDKPLSDFVHFVFSSMGVNNKISYFTRKRVQFGKLRTNYEIQFASIDFSKILERDMSNLIHYGGRGDITLI